MSKEEIIIDGINVTECRYELNGYCTIGFEKSNDNMLICRHCEDYSNCYFKQLKRKEHKLNKYMHVIDMIKEYCRLYKSKLNIPTLIIEHIIKKIKV